MSPNFGWFRLDSDIQKFNDAGGFEELKKMFEGPEPGDVWKEIILEMEASIGLWWR